MVKLRIWNSYKTKTKAKLFAQRLKANNVEKVQIRKNTDSMTNDELKWSVFVGGKNSRITKIYF